MGGNKAKVIKRWMMKFTNWMELVLSVFMVVVLLLMIIRMVLLVTPEAWTGGITVQHILEEALEIAIGVEFIKMLCLHTPGTILEVLLFAIARHMIVKENTAVEALLGIVAIAGLFAIHKFLLVSHKEMEHMSFKASATVGFVNLTSGVDIHENNDVAIGDYLAAKLREKGMEVKVGASAYRRNYMLRVEKMDGENITRVELVYKE